MAKVFEFTGLAGIGTGIAVLVSLLFPNGMIACVALAIISGFVSYIFYKNGGLDDKFVYSILLFSALVFAIFIHFTT